MRLLGNQHEVIPVGRGLSEAAGQSQNDQSSNEVIEAFGPPAGTYIVDVHGYNTDDVAGGPGAEFRLFAWSFGNFVAGSNLTVSGAPANVTRGSEAELTAIWQGLTSGLWLGGITHSDAGGIVDLTVVEVENDFFPQPIN